MYVPFICKIHRQHDEMNQSNQNGRGYTFKSSRFDETLKISNED